MRARDLLVGLCLGWASLNVPGASSHGQGDPAPLEIAVVTSYSDLLRSEPIWIGSTSVRVGVSSRECARGAGVLLYCITDGFQPPETSHYHHNGLGPLRIAVIGSGLASKPPRPDGSAGPSLSPPPRRFLFVNEVQCRNSEDYVVELWDAGDRVVAKTPLRVRDRFVQLPIALKNLEEEVTGQSREDAVEVDWARSIATPDGRLLAAAPAWDGSEPWPVLGADVDLALPTREPVEDGSLTIEFDKETNTLSLSDEKALVPSLHYFLVNVWINGKPLEPVPFLVPLTDQARSYPRVMRVVCSHAAKSFRFHLDLKDEHLGLKRGDEVSVQLIYCPRGWRFMGSQQWGVVIETGDASIVSISPQPRASNIVKFRS